MAKLTFEISTKSVEPPFVLIKPGVSDEEFFEFMEEDIACELLEGVLFVHSPASLEHEEIFQFLLIMLNRFLAKAGEGKVLGSRFVMRLAQGIIPEPDLMVLTPRTLAQLKDTFLEGPADIVIEILSPSTREIDLSKKLPQYLAHGVHEVWIIDPETKEIQIHRPEKSTESYINEQRASSSVLPKFWIRPVWLWNVSTYDPGDCLQEVLSSTKNY